MTCTSVVCHGSVRSNNTLIIACPAAPIQMSGMHGAKSKSNASPRVYTSDVGVCHVRAPWASCRRRGVLLWLRMRRRSEEA